jgi:hypothetical protein
MKQIKTLLIASILILGANQKINAQAKTAHVDVSEIMSKMYSLLLSVYFGGNMASDNVLPPELRRLQH